MTTHCKAATWTRGGWYSIRCSRKATKDGYCWQHHPDAVEKRRKENRQKMLERLAREDAGWKRKMERESLQREIADRYALGVFDRGRPVEEISLHDAWGRKLARYLELRGLATIQDDTLTITREEKP
jgi:hypothetical protein